MHAIRLFKKKHANFINMLLYHTERDQEFNLGDENLTDLNDRQIIQ